METIKLTEQNTIYFMQGDGDAEILKLCENGDIFVKGKLAENDKQVVDALREFLKGQSLYNVSDLLDLGGWFDGSPEFVEEVVNDWLNAR